MVAFLRTTALMLGVIVISVSAALAFGRINPSPQLLYTLREDFILYDLRTGVHLEVLSRFHNPKSYPTWSANGRYLAFTHLEDEFTPSIYVWDIEGDTVNLVAPSGINPRWSVNGEQIIFELPTSSIMGLPNKRMIVDRSGLNAYEAPPDASVSSIDLKASPDGRWSIYRSDSSGQFSLYAVNVITDRQRHIIHLSGYSVAYFWRP